MKPKPSQKTIAFIIFLVLLNSTNLLYSQISAYSSASYGYSSNPLYNYQKLSDQLFQTYFEIASEHYLESSDLKFQYVGGSMIFNRFTLRNYYEHSISVGFGTKIFKSSIPITENDEEKDDADAELTEQIDSTGIFFHSDFQTSARYDKKEFREFDNYGFSWNNLMRFNVGNGYSGGVNAKTEYRYYQYLHPYNNFSEIFTFNLENGMGTPFQYGVSISGGLKYFPKIKYDTALFEETRSYIIQNMPDSTLVRVGQQRYWVYSTYPDTSESVKILLTKPTTKSAYQIALSGFVQQNWNNALFRAEIIYRINSRSTLLTLVQNSSTLTLNEDLYNSVFNAHGPELHFLVKYLLPLDLQLSTNLDVEHRIYETPAYALVSGEPEQDRRKDFSTNLEINISKFFRFSDMIGFDVSLNSSYLRNQSNDAYNDYSLFGYSISFGCSF